MRYSIAYLPLLIGTSVFCCTDLTSAETVNNKEVKAENDMTQAAISVSSIAAEAWLGLLDHGKFEESWKATSKITQDKIPEKDWVKILDKTRRPLGMVKSRNILDVRTSENPKNLPAGKYMVFFYNTSFAKKSVAYELITLHLDSDGQWRVLTYQVD